MRDAHRLQVLRVNLWHLAVRPPFTKQEHLKDHHFIWTFPSDRFFLLMKHHKESRLDFFWLGTRMASISTTILADISMTIS
jgi:hypothetical protein